MPIDIDRFEDPEAIDEAPTSERIVRFLAAHDEQAFTRREIADAIDAAPETVGTNLTRLKQRGLVRHREPYWAFTDDREQAMTTLRARYGDAVPTDGDETDTSGAGTAEDGGDANGEPVAVGPEQMADETAGGGDEEPDHDAPSHREAARAFLERVHEQVGEAVDEVYLFGSVAAGTATPDSDVDVLVVVADDADYAAVDDRLLDIAYDVHLDSGVRIEVHSMRADEFETRQARGDPFVRSVLKEGEARG